MHDAVEKLRPPSTAQTLVEVPAPAPANPKATPATKTDTNMRTAACILILFGLQANLADLASDTFELHVCKMTRGMFDALNYSGTARLHSVMNNLLKAQRNYSGSRDAFLRCVLPQASKT